MMESYNWRSALDAMADQEQGLLGADLSVWKGEAFNEGGAQNHLDSGFSFGNLAMPGAGASGLLDLEGQYVAPKDSIESPSPATPHAPLPVWTTPQEKEPSPFSDLSTAVKWVDNKLTSIVGKDTIGKLYAGAILAGATEIGKYLTAKDTNKQAIVKQQAEFNQADKTLLANQQYTDKTRQEEWAREDAKNARRWATPVKVRRRSTTAQPTTTV